MSFESSKTRIGRSLAGLERVERAVTFGAFGVLVVVVFGDVVSRETVGTGLHWARQVGVYANLFVILFGIGMASATGSHLRPRFADGWLPARWSGVLERMQDGGMALFCLGFAVIAARIAFDGYILDERSAVLGIVTWPFQAVFPLVFLFATFRHGVYACYPELRPVPPESAVPTPGGGR